MEKLTKGAVATTITLSLIIGLLSKPSNCIKGDNIFLTDKKTSICTIGDRTEYITSEGVYFELPGALEKVKELDEPWTGVQTTEGVYVFKNGNYVSQLHQVEDVYKLYGGIDDKFFYFVTFSPYSTTVFSVDPYTEETMFLFSHP